MPEIEIGIPMPFHDGRGRRKGEDRLALEALYTAPKGASVFFHFPTRPKALAALAQAVGGSGWYSIRSDGIRGVRVWNIRGSLVVEREPE